MSGIPIISTLSRQGGANFPIALGEDIIGAFVTVASTGARDAIPTAILRTGALVRIAGTNNFYEWTGSIWSLYGGFGGAGHAIKDEGVAVTPRNSLNFVGSNVSLSDDGSNTIVTIGAISLTAGVSGVLPVANGGTGLSAGGSNGTILTMVSGAPAWAAPGGGSLTAPANPADDGKLAIAASGNFSYALLANANVSATAAIALSKLADGAACSVAGRSANSTGAHADIASSADGDVFRRAGGALGWGTIATAGIADSAVTLAKLANATAVSVLGRSANSAGVYADIAAVSDGDVLRRSGSTVGFGTIATAGIADGAVTAAKLSSLSLTDIPFVALATTGNVTLSGEQTIDGTLTSSSRVLVWKQTTPSQNGVYVTGAGAWTRATDMDATAEFRPGVFFCVAGGTVHGGKLAALMTTGAITVGSTNIQFALTFPAPVDVTDDNKVAIASGGTLSFALLANAQVDPAAAIAGSKINPDFGAQNVTTTGGFIGNSGSSFLRLGLVAGSGAGVASAASVGGIRLPRGDGAGAKIYGRSDDDTTDTVLFQWNSSTPRIVIGDATGFATAYIYLQNGNIGQLRAGTNATAEWGAGTFKIFNSASTRIETNATGIGVFGAAPVAKPTVTGSRGANAALADLLTKLALIGWLTDSSS